MRHSVGLSDTIREELRDFLNRAPTIAEDRRIREAFAAILDMLRDAPHLFGEPMYHLRGMRMEVRKAAVAPVYVEYGVHEDRPVVVIRRVRWLNDPSPA